MAPPNALHIVLGEVSLVVTALRRNSRWQNRDPHATMLEENQVNWQDVLSIGLRIPEWETGRQFPVVYAGHGILSVHSFSLQYLSFTGSYPSKFRPTKERFVQMRRIIDVGPKRFPESIFGGDSFGRHVWADHRHRSYLAQQVSLIWSRGHHLLRKRRRCCREYRGWVLWATLSVTLMKKWRKKDEAGVGRL